MTKDQLLLSFDLLDEQYIEEAAPTAAKPKKRRVILTRAAACAVLLAILVPAILLVLPMLQAAPAMPPEENNPSAVYDPPTIFNALESPDLLYGNGNPFVVGDTTEVSSAVEDTPDYTFEYSHHLVHAEIVSISPDVYYCLDESDDVAPQAYHLIHFRTLEVLNGIVPAEFLYLSPAWPVEKWFATCDTFILSMKLQGFENYIIRNETQNKLQCLPLLLFNPSDPAYYNVIPFADGIIYYRQHSIFGHNYYPEFIAQGSTEEDTIILIKQLLDKIHSEKTPYRNILTYSTDFKTEEAKAAFAYVQPFENGVFVQRIERSNYYRDGHPMLIYTRYIGECQTEETITIDLETEEVFYSEVRYTEDELCSIVNISEYVARLRNQYAAQIPAPPHTDLQRAELSALNVFGRYVKIDGKIYGYVKTTWLYRVMQYSEHGKRDVLLWCYDDSYLLFDAQGIMVREISRDELLEITDGASSYQDFLCIYTGEYNKAKEIPCG